MNDYISWEIELKRDEPNYLLGDEFSVQLFPKSGRWKIYPKSQNPSEHFELEDDCEYEQSVASVTATIFLSNICNLRCTYCRFKEWTFTGEELGRLNPDSVVQEALEASFGREKLIVHFQGGEPLVHVELLDQVCGSISAGLREGCTVEFNLTTNGTLLTDRVVEVIKRHNIGVTISIDGSAQSHDKFRPFANGDGSHSRAMDAVRIMRSNEIPFGIFSVVCDAEKMFDQYLYFIDEMDAKSVLLAPLEAEGDEDSEFVREYSRQFVDGQIKILRHNVHIYRTTGRKLCEELTHLYLGRKIFPNEYVSACHATPYSKCGSDMLSIERDGSRVPCQNLRDKAMTTSESREKMLKRHEICTTCEINGHCGAPVCFSRLSIDFNNRFANGDRHAADFIEAVCDSNKRRESKLFEMFYKQKDALLEYFFELEADWDARPDLEPRSREKEID